MKESRSVISVSKETLEFEPKEEEKQGPNICPLSFTKGKRILRKTLASNIRPRYWNLIRENGYFFCEIRDCPITYFNNQEKYYFGLNDMVEPVMHKMEIGTEDRPLCYCKNVLESVVIHELLDKQCCDSIKDIQKFTEANTGKYCAITNPLGRCCGKQIKEVLEWAKEQRLEIHPPVLEEAEACCDEIGETSDELYEINANLID